MEKLGRPWLVFQQEAKVHEALLRHLLRRWGVLVVDNGSSGAVRNRVLEHGAPAQKVERIHPGIDLQRFRFSDLNRSRQRQRWEIPDSAFDCFLMTSELEDLGFTLIEAMACGSPCIATDSLGPREIISATDLGWLITQDDWEGFLKAMREVSGLSEAVRWEFRSRMRMHVEERFDAAKQFPKIADQVLGTVVQERT